jgi:PhnB protein
LYCASDGIFDTALPVPPERFEPMRSSYLRLLPDTSAEAEQIYALLFEGGGIFRKMEETFFAIRLAMLRDRLGTSWMLPNERSRPSAA